MHRAQSLPKFHLDIEIERTLRQRRQLFKSKTNLNIEELDPEFIQSYNSNKYSTEEDSTVNMAENNNTIDMEKTRGGPSGSMHCLIQQHSTLS